MTRTTASLALSLLIATSASAVNLQDIYGKAISADPTMQQAEAQHLSSREAKTQAWLNMLPLAVSASKNVSGVASSTTNNSPAVGALNLRVNLFSWERWIALKQANKSVAQGEANFQAAQQSLIQRVATRYFAVLEAEDQLASQESALASSNRSLEQAERRYEVGLIAVTDVQIARADRDSNAASAIRAKRSLSTAQEQLRAITGERYERLAAPREDMPLLTPEPASEESWVSTAMAQNASLTASRMSADISRDRYLSAVGNYIPDISVTASKGWAIEGDNGTPVPGVNDDVTWSVSASLPINIGGTQSTIRTAKYDRNASLAGYERSIRETELSARDNYQGVISQIAQVQALKQAVESSRVSLQAVEAGYEVGTKTALDVLNARSNLVRAETSYAQSKYGYLNSIVGLRLAAGILDRDTITQINGWLAERAVPAAASAPAPPAATP